MTMTYEGHSFNCGTNVPPYHNAARVGKTLLEFVVIS